MTGCRIEPEILLAFISFIGIHFFPPKDCREKPGQQMTHELKMIAPVQVVTKNAAGTIMKPSLEPSTLNPETLNINDTCPHTSCLSTSRGERLNRPLLLARPVTTVSRHTSTNKINTGVNGGSNGVSKV